MEFTLTETGALTLFGLIFGFLLRCCSQIEQSRCSHIDLCGVKCDRNVLSEEHLARLQRENETKQENNTNNV